MRGAVRRDRRSYRSLLKIGDPDALFVAQQRCKDFFKFNRSFKLC
jgi:hypothetical protein